MPKKTHSIHVIISGRVQGVGYRAWCAGRARKMGIDGWVRNRTDGTVEAVFSGCPIAIEELVQQCEDGPFAARVTDIRSEIYKEDVEDGFISLPTV